MSKIFVKMFDIRIFLTSPPLYLGNFTKVIIKNPIFYSLLFERSFNETASIRIFAITGSFGK